MGGIVGVGCRAVTCMCVCAQGVWPSWPAEHNLIQWVCHKGVCVYKMGELFLLGVCRSAVTGCLQSTQFSPGGEYRFCGESIHHVTSPSQKKKKKKKKCGNHSV